MRKNITRIAKLAFVCLLAAPTYAQTAPCDGTLPFEEQNGLLTIEMESGIRNDSRWQTGSENDPNLEGETIDYIFWNGPESFNALTGATITYNIKINNPGTYRLLWRGRIGLGTSRGEHNDAWLRIVADDFFATQSSSLTSAQVEPTPNCTTNPDRECPEGAKVAGYFKAFMNVDPTGPADSVWRFVTNTNDGTAFRFIKATFDTPGNYSVIVDARSSFFFMDKMVLFREDVPSSTATNLENPESLCFDQSLSTNDTTLESGFKIFPNPATNSIQLNNISNVTVTKLAIRNVLGATIREIELKSDNQTVNISGLKSGVYFISSLDNGVNFTKRFIKL